MCYIINGLTTINMVIEKITTGNRRERRLELGALKIANANRSYDDPIEFLGKRAMKGKNMRFKSFTVTTLVFGVLVSIYSNAQEQIPNETTAASPTSDAREVAIWGAGVNYGFTQNIGISVFRRLDSNWMAEISANWDGNCCGKGGGGNPSTGIPFGWENQSAERSHIALLLERRFSLYSDRSWFLFASAGLGVEQTSTRVQFYNEAFIGFDRNSPAGTQSTYQKRFFVPGRVGARRSDFTFFGNPSEASLFIDFALNGPNERPTIVAPNGQPVKSDSFNQYDASLKFALSTFF